MKQLWDDPSMRMGIHLLQSGSRSRIPPADTRTCPGMGDTARVNCPVAATFCSFSSDPPWGSTSSREESVGFRYILAFGTWCRPVGSPVAGYAGWKVPLGVSMANGASIQGTVQQWCQA